MEKKKINKYEGSTLQDFLEEDGIAEEVEALALKKLLAIQLKQEMKRSRLSKVQMAKKMATSRASLDRLLNPNKFPSISLRTLCKAASSVGKHVRIEIV